MNAEGPFEVICLSPDPWNAPLWTNRQHIMSRLAHVHRVLYVEETPRFLGHHLHRILRGQQPLRILRRLLGAERVGEHLYVHCFWNLIPFGRRWRWVRLFNQRLGAWIVRLVASFLRFHRTVVWTYDPMSCDLVRYLRGSLSCYDCVDEHSAQPAYQHIAEEERKEEQRLLSNVDLVFTTSPYLYRMKSRWNRHTYLVPNVGDFEHFVQAHAEETPVPPEIRALPKPIIGFVGAISTYKLNLKLLWESARQRPDWSWVFIGPVVTEHELLDRLRALPHVHFWGYRPYAELPGYLKGMDVTIIPYQRNAYTVGCFPLKFYEYLAAGKPVVVSNLPALEEYRPLIEMAETPAEFVAAIERVWKTDSPEKVERRLALARKNSWEHRVQKLVHLIKGAIG